MGTGDTDRAGGKWRECGKGGDVGTSHEGRIGFRAGGRGRGQFQAIEQLAIAIMCCAEEDSWEASRQISEPKVK